MWGNSAAQEALKAAKVAVGGTKNLDCVKRLGFTGTIIQSNGMVPVAMGGTQRDSHAARDQRSTVRALLELSARFRIDQTFLDSAGNPGTTLVRCIDGEQFRQDYRAAPSNPDGLIRVVSPPPPATPEARSRFKRIWAMYAFSLLLFSDSGDGLEIDHVRRASGAEVLVGRRSDGTNIELYLDEKTHLPRALRWVTGPGPQDMVEWTLSEHRSVGILRLPFRIRMVEGTKPTTTLDVSEYILNPSDGAIFTK
jgi:hypothetical protein